MPSDTFTSHKIQLLLYWPEYFVDCQSIRSDSQSIVSTGQQYLSIKSIQNVYRTHIFSFILTQSVSKWTQTQVRVWFNFDFFFSPLRITLFWYSRSFRQFNILYFSIVYVSFALCARNSAKKYSVHHYLDNKMNK